MKADWLTAVVLAAVAVMLKMLESLAYQLVKLVKYTTVALVTSNLKLVCSIDWEMRLVNGGSSLEGRLEVCLNGVWGTICDQSWDDNDAGVACSQMGYSARG